MMVSGGNPVPVMPHPPFLLFQLIGQFLLVLLSAGQETSGLQQVVLALRDVLQEDRGRLDLRRLRSRLSVLRLTCTCCVFRTLRSFSTSAMRLVALAISARSRSRSASSCSMCCCFSFRASCSAVVPEILRA